jgi:hypothetical protein
VQCISKCFICCRPLDNLAHKEWYVFQSFYVAWYAGNLEAGSLQPCSVEHSTGGGRKRARKVGDYPTRNLDACSLAAVMAGARVTPLKKIQA